MSLVGKWFGFGSDADYDAGLRAYEKGAFDEALVKLETALERQPEGLARYYLASTHRKLGEAALDTEDFESAVEHFAAARELYPSYPDLALSHARALRLAERLDEAEAAIAEGLALNPHFGEGRLFEGLLRYERLGEWEGVRAAVTQYPGLEGTLFDEAQQAHAAGDAKGAAERIAEIRPGQVQALEIRLRVADEFARVKRFLEAAAEYRQVLESAPHYADVHCKLGQVLLELGEPEEALQAFEAALERNPRYAEAHAQKGVALRTLGRGKEAKLSFKEALSVNPNHPIARFELGRPAI